MKNLKYYINSIINDKEKLTELYHSGLHVPMIGNIEGCKLEVEYISENLLQFRFITNQNVDNEPFELVLSKSYFHVSYDNDLVILDEINYVRLDK